MISFYIRYICYAHKDVAKPVFMLTKDLSTCTHMMEVLLNL